MKKALLCIFIMMLMACVLLPVSAAENEQVKLGEQVAADAAKMTFPTDGSTCEAVCPVHGTSVTWTPLTPGEAIVLTTDTHYYLTDSVSNSKVRFTAPNKWNQYACLHLNGKSITNTAGAVFVGKNGQLHVMGSGEIKGGATAENAGATVSISCGGSYGAINLYGGTYSKYDPTSLSNTIGVGYNGGILSVYSGATVKSGSGGSAVYMQSAMDYVHATFNLYGGTIDATDGTEVAIDTEAVADDHAKKLTVNMYAGTVKNGSDSYGGNLIIRNHVTFNMYGGTIEGGNAATSGGNIAIYGGAVMNMSGGTVTGGTAGANGGNIYLTNYVTDTEKSLAVLNMSGGTVTGGTAVNGGNILLYNQTAMNMTGGTVEKGTAEQTGGNIASKLSGSATKEQYAEFYFENAIIRDGKTTASSNSYGGGNISFRKANAVIAEGTQILNGHTASRGGNFQLLRGTILMTGGEISGGIADRSSGYEEIHLESDTDMSVMYMLGGRIEGREAENGAIRVNGMSRFYLGGNATIADEDPDIHEIRVYSTGKLFICDGWSGSASVNCSDSWAVDDTAATDKLQVVTLDADRNETAGGSYTGKLTHAGTGAMLLGKGDGTVKVGGIALMDNSGNATLATDVLNQWATGEFAFIRLYSDYTLADPGYGLKVDLNGYGLTLTGKGAVSVFDTTADAFEVPTGTVTAADTIAIEQNTVAPNGNRYIALENNGTISMHRLEMRISEITLRPSAAGIYYNAVYYCDSVLADAVETYGVALSVSGMPDADLSQSCYTALSAPLENGVTASSVAVFGILKDGQTSDMNRQNGEMKIYANPYIRLKDADSTVLLGDRKNAGKTADTEGFDGVAYSLYDLLCRMDKTYYDMKPAARRILDTFCQSWQDKGMEKWLFENVGSEILNVDNGPLQFAPGTTEAVCPVCEKSVTWTAFQQSGDTTKRIGRPVDGGHYYLTEDVVYTSDTAAFILPPVAGATACFHLNGHNLTSTGYRAVYMTGSAGTLNIMGEGTVSGNEDAVGAVIYISTSNADATLNLYGGTYVKPDSNGRSLTIIASGGSMYVHSGAWLKNNGTSYAVYVDTAKNADATVGIYGGKVTGGEIRGTTLDVDTHLRSYIVSGRAYIEGMLINDTDLSVSISGTPVIGRLRINDNFRLNIGQLNKGADIAVSVNTSFTQPLQNPESYLPYFRAWNGIDSIGIDEEGALCYNTNYEYYMTPYIRDVRAQAIADGQIHYYFMAGKGMIMNPENNDAAACKWGDSCLVVFPNGETMLIDTGYAVQAPVIAGSLKRMGVTTLDYLVITHPHNDHYGGAFGAGSTFLDEIYVEKVYYDDGQYPDNSFVGVIEKTCSERNIPYETLKMGDVLTFGGVTMTVLWPGADLSTEDLAMDDAENKHSMVFRFDYGEHSSLFTADIYTYTETKLQELYTAGELDVDMMKVPHHGIGQSSLAFIQAVSPEIAVATGYHVISSAITDRYDAENVTLLEDIYHGYIHIASGTDGIMSVETEQ